MTKKELQNILHETDYQRGKILRERLAALKAKSAPEKEIFAEAATKLKVCTQREKDAVVQFISETYGLKKTAAEAIFNKAYEDGHSNGSAEIVLCAEDLAEFVLKVIHSNQES